MKANGVKTNLEYLHRLKSAKSLIPSKPLKHARSMSTKDGASISLARSLGRKSSKGYQEGPGESRQLSTADSVYSMAHSVDLSGGDMSQLGLEKSNMGSSRYRNDSFTSASGMSAITAPDKPLNKSRSFTKPHSLYKSKSQRLLANAVFADGGTTCIKTREEDDRREEQEANSRDEDDDRAETAHDESVDDWF